MFMKKVAAIFEGTDEDGENITNLRCAKDAALFNNNNNNNKNGEPHPPPSPPPPKKKKIKVFTQKVWKLV